MKLRRIEVENLASLQGKQIIDFTEALAAAPIFLVLGPTGSGKSTLLDAISLALFGATPRLRKTKGDAEADPRLIMARGTGECRAMVEFSKLDPQGQRRVYQAEWYCNRADRKPTGNLQEPRRTVRVAKESGGWEVLASSTKAKEVSEAFDAMLEGLEVEDFKRSVLLAQGEFAAFLKADERSRGAILERMTGTERFRDLGRRVAEHCKVHKKKVGDLELQVGASTLRNPEEEARLLAQEAEARRLQEALQAEVAQWEGFLRSAKEVQRLRRELAETTQTLAKVDSDLEGASEKREEATRAVEGAREVWERAKTHRATLLPEIQKAKEARIHWQKAKEGLSKAEAEAQRVDKAWKAAEERWLSARKVHDETAAARMREEEALRAVEAHKEWLVRLPTIDEAVRTLQNDVRGGQLKASDFEEVQVAPEVRAAARERVLAERQAVLDGADDWAARRKGLLERQHLVLERLRRLENLQVLVGQWEKTHATLGAMEGALSTAREALEAARRARTQDEKAVADCRAHLTTRTAHWEDLKWMMGLAKGRKLLEPQTPCPLCGSTDHPAVGDAAQKAVDDELLARAQGLEKEVTEAKAAFEAAESQAKTSQKDEARQGAHHESLVRQHTEEKRREQEALGAVRRGAEALGLSGELSSSLLDAAQRGARDEDAALRAAMARLEAAEKAWAHEERLVLAERYLAQRDYILGLLREGGAHLEGTEPKARIQSGLEDARKKAAAYTSAQKAKDAAEKVAQEAALAFSQAQVSRDAAEAERGRILLSMQSAQEEVAKTEAVLAPLLGGRDPVAVDAETQNEESKAAAALGELEKKMREGEMVLKELQTRRTSAEEQKARLGVDLARAEVALGPALEAGAVLGDGQVDVARFDALRQRRDDAVRQWGAIEQMIRHQNQEKARVGALQRDLDEAKTAEHSWSRLHELMGKNEGEDFKLFALTLELESLIERANRRLEFLAPRYRLTQGVDAEGRARLAFTISDTYQAGEVRPLSTLSGGETFLVSLALALALSDYRSLRMPMETLLLDEGFGTLDPETLNTAMGALETLHATGVQVGVISHVEALKERIFARIRVKPLGRGRSTVLVEA